MKISASTASISQLNGRTFARVTIGGVGRKPEKFHTLLLIDCSGSMSESIDEVRKDTQAFVQEMDQTDFVSVLIFSGHKTSKVIAGPTECTKNGRDILCKAIEKEVRILNTTVFSEPLSLAIETVRRHAGPEMAHNTVLFTDGCAVPEKWSTEEEQRKSLNYARELGGTGVPVSAIGYGVYYDLMFLGNLIGASGADGTFQHVSEIDNFRNAVEKTRKSFRAMRMADLDLKFVCDKGNATNVFRTLPQVFSLGTTGTAKVRGIPDDSVTFYVETTASAGKITLKGTVDGKDIQEVVKLDSATDAEKTEFIRILGANAFLQGQHDTAAELLRMVGDDGLAEKAQNAYSDRESRETSVTFRDLFTEGKKFIGKGLKPQGPNHNLLNVLRSIIEDPDNIVSIPKGAYKRSGISKKDPRVVENPNGRTLQVIGYTSHNDRFNFSVKAKKDIKVLPEDFKGPAVDRKTFRTYNLILDGNLHVPELDAVISKEATFALLQEAGVIDAKQQYARSKSYKLDLRNIKLVSPTWANPSTLGLVGLLKKEADLEVKQTAVNKQAKSFGVVDKDDDDAEIYHEQGVEDPNAVKEFYTATHDEIRLMGYKAPAYDASVHKTYKEADAVAKATRQELTSTRFMIRAITFAMNVTKSKSIKWDGGKTTKRGKDPKNEMTATFDGAKLKRVTWTSQEACS